MGIAVGWDGIILTTEDGGTTWSRQGSGMKTDLAGIALSSDGLTGIAVGRGGVILTTEDGGTTWSKRHGEKGQSLQDIALNSDGLTGVAVGGGGVILTTEDGGTTWARQDSGIKTGLEGIALSSDGRVGIAVGWRGITLTTKDGGITWNRQDIGRGKILQDIALSSEGRMGIVVGMKGPLEGTLLTTKDDGITWSDPQEIRERNREKLLTDRNALVQENRYLEIGLVKPLYGERSDFDKRITANAWNYLTLTASWRLPILALSMFLAQVLFGLNRYHTRLAAFYSARADALSLLCTENNSASLEVMERATWVLSPQQVDFGRAPQAMPQQTVDLLSPQTRLAR